MYGLSENVRGGKQTQKKINRSINHTITTITLGGKKEGTKATTARKFMCLDSCERWRGLSGSSADSIITLTLFFFWCVCLIFFLFLGDGNVDGPRTPKAAVAL